MKTPISDISQDELQQRVSRVRDSMRERGYDALLVYDEGGIIGGGNVRYLAGYSHVPPPSPSMMVVGATGDPILCQALGMSGAGLNLTDIYAAHRRVKVVGGGVMAPKWVEGVCEALSEAGFTKGRLGVDGLGLMRYPIVDGLKKQLEGVEIVDARGLVENVRRIKSEAEIAAYKRAGILSKQAMDIFMDAVKPGVRQDVAIAEAAHAVGVADAEALDVIHGCGDPWVWGMGPRGDLTFEEGDLVACELNARYHGYYAQLCRTWALGRVSPEKQRALDATRAAHDRMLNMLKPGVTAQELYKAGLEEVHKRDYDFNGVRYGHGLGLTIGEGWDFADWDTKPLEENALGVFHPFVIKESGGRGQFNALWGDPWVLRANGPEMVCP